MPKLWDATIETHRRQVRDAILETTAALVAERGLRAVTMSRIASETGIGRATLYKYFSGVEAILFAWHERQISSHLAQLTEAQKKGRNPSERLEAMLQAYALISRESHAFHRSQVSAHLHRGEAVAQAQRRVRNMFRDVLAEGIATGELRSDVPPEELTAYCLHALGASASIPSAAAVGRLVAVTMAGLRPGAHAS
jgi:AcrR family transcriptional regulator